MNAKKAKALRKKIYGDTAQGPTRYEIGKIVVFRNKAPTVTGRCLVCKGLREKYLEAKKVTKGGQE